MYTDRESIITEICARLSKGEPLAQICRDVHMPDRTVVYDWANENENVSQRIARAREIGYDAIADDCLSISDTPVVGVEERVTPAVKNREGEVVVPEAIELKRGDMLGHRKLQIETRLKLLAKWDPKRYGDKQQVEHSGQVDTVGILTEARKRSGR